MYMSFRKNLKTYLSNQAFPTWILMFLYMDDYVIFLYMDDYDSLHWLTILASNCNFLSDFSLVHVGFEPWFTGGVSNL